MQKTVDLKTHKVLFQIYIYINYMTYRRYIEKITGIYLSKTEKVHKLVTPRYNFLFELWTFERRLRT